MSLDETLSSALWTRRTTQVAGQVRDSPRLIKDGGVCVCVRVFVSRCHRLSRRTRTRQIAEPNPRYYLGKYITEVRLTTSNNGSKYWMMNGVSDTYLL